MNVFTNIFSLIMFSFCKKGKTIAFVLFIFLCIQACKSGKDEVFPNSTFKINFIDKNKNQIRNVNVLLFNNKSEYSQSLWDLKGTGAKSYFTSTDILTLEGLEKGEFWIQCNASDSSIVSKPIRLNNNLGGYTINNNYIDANKVALEIMLQPASGQVVFYASSLSPTGNIQVTINNKQLQGILTASSLAPPSPDAKDGSVFTFSSPNSSFTYFAKSTDNCTWTGKVDVGTENVKYIKLSPCRLGSVTFVGELGTNVFIGEDTEPSGTIPVSGQLVLQLPDAVTYTWFAKNATCAWSGTVLVNNNPTVTLPICN